jgi:hypothetical protein
MRLREQDSPYVATSGPISTYQPIRSLHTFTLSTSPLWLTVPKRVRSLWLNTDGSADVLFGFNDLPSQYFRIKHTDSVLVLGAEFFDREKETIIYFQAVTGTPILYLCLITE